MPLRMGSPLGERAESIAADVVDAVGAVRRELGVGLLERGYARALHVELAGQGHSVETEVVLPFIYKGQEIPGGYRLDLWVDRTVVVECKAVEELRKEHYAQVLTYLRLSGCRLGFLVNFAAVPLGTGIKRLVL